MMSMGNFLDKQCDDRRRKGVSILRQRQNGTLSRVRRRRFRDIVVVMPGSMGTGVEIKAAEIVWLPQNFLEQMMHPMGRGEDHEKQKCGGKQNPRIAPAAK
jgi:hypothetical protein